MAKIIIELNDDLHTAIRIASAKSGLMQKEIILSALEDYQLIKENRQKIKRTDKK